MDKNTLLSSFGKWVSPNFQKLSEQVEYLKQDYYTKKLTTEAYIKLLLFAQLHELESLHAISEAILDEDLQKTLRFESISASQLSRKTNNLKPEILSALFLDLVTKIQGYHHQRKRNLSLKIIDSSTFPLNLTNYKWATFRKNKGRCKAAFTVRFHG